MSCEAKKEKKREAKRKLRIVEYNENGGVWTGRSRKRIEWGRERHDNKRVFEEKIVERRAVKAESKPSNYQDDQGLGHFHIC